MNDLQKAKKTLTTKKLTLCIIKNGRIVFETRRHGISGFLDAIEKNSKTLEASSVADKVAGKAIALLCAYAKVNAIYAATMSSKAQTLLKQYHVQHEWHRLVEDILDKDRTDVCPFEKMAEQTSDPADAYERFKTLQESLRNSK
jgi:ribosome biogenesis protein Tsr3